MSPLVVVAWGLAQRPYLIPTSLTVDAGGRSVDDIALAAPRHGHRGGARRTPLVLLYRLDTGGALQPLAENDLRRTAADRGGSGTPPS
ncbi:hypothetical protein ACFSNO_03135 [Streptomyces cirratus]